METMLHRGVEVVFGITMALPLSLAIGNYLDCRARAEGSGRTGVSRPLLVG